MGVERIPDKDSRRDIVSRVQGRMPSTQIGIVHARQIIVNQRIGMKHLQCQSRRISRLDQKRLIRLNDAQQKHRPKSLASSKQHIAQRIDIGVMKGLDRGKMVAQIGFKSLHDTSLFQVGVLYPKPEIKILACA